MLTEDDLISFLDEQRVPISKRVLTDWRQKGFLPPLDSKGLGRGNGKLHYWSDPRVAERALLVDELLCNRFTGTDIRLMLWLFGYDVPLATIRQRFLEEAKQVKQVLTGGNVSPGEIEDHVFDFVAKYGEIAAKVNGKHGEAILSTSMPSEAMETFINVPANDGYDLTDEPFLKGARLLAEPSDKRRLERQSDTGTDSQDASVPVRANDETLREMTLLLRRHFTMSKVERALTEASDEQQLRARVDLNIIFAALHNFVGRAPELQELRPFRLRAVYVLGSIAVVIALTLRNEGRGDFVDEWLSKLLEYSLAFDGTQVNATRA